MKFKQKTLRRLVLIALVAVALVASALAVVYGRRWQNNRRLETARAEGLAAFQKGEFAVAIDRLGPYVRKRTRDREALLALAKARADTEEGGGSHLTQSLAFFQRAFALDESDKDTALRLVRAYLAVGYTSEARDLAQRFRPADLSKAGPEHAEFLTEEVRARLASRTDDPAALATAARLAEILPADFGATQMLVAAKARYESRDAAVEVLRQRVAAAPDDLALQFLLASTDARPGEPLAPVLAAACRLAGLDPANGARTGPGAFTTPELAAQLVSVLDALGRRDLSLAVLAEGAERLKNATLSRAFARRAWQAGNQRRLLEAFPQSGAPAHHAEALAFVGLALAESKQDPSWCIEALRARPRDFYANVWLPVLESIAQNTPTQDRLKTLEAAARAFAREPVFAYLRGEALAQLGRADEARGLWRSVYDSQLSAGWALPMLRVCETYLAEARADEAVRAATDALSIGGNSLAAGFALLRAQCMTAETGRPLPDPAGALTRLDRAIEQISLLPDPATARDMLSQLQPGRVALLVLAGRKPEAIDAARAILSAQPPPSPETARRIAALSARLGLGLEDAALAAADAAGATPQTALTRALLLDARGKRAEAIDLLRAGADAAPSERRLPWVLARAQFLDSVADAGAADVWRGLVRENASNLDVQTAAIRSVTVARDAALLAEVIDRLQALGASDPSRPSVEVRFARARSLLLGKPTPARRDEAVALLRGILVDNPDLSAARFTLIDALLATDAAAGLRPDRPGAIEQLRAALARGGAQPALTLRLAELLVAEGNRQQAQDELLRLAIDERADPAGRLDAVDALLTQNAVEQATRALQSLAATPDASPSVLLRLADAYTRVRRNAGAAAVYARLASARLPDPDSIVAVVIAARALGDEASARAALVQLERADLAGWRREIARARLADAEGRPADADAALEAAVQLGASEPEAWLSAARVALVAKRFDRAADLARRGLEAHRGDTQIAVVAEQARLAAGGGAGGGGGLEALAAAYERSPATQALAPIIRDLARAQAAGDLSDPAKLVDLARRFPDQPRLIALVIGLLMQLQPPEVSEALALVRSAGATFPGNPDIAKAAAGVCIAAGDWPAAVQAAQTWRLADRSPDADLALAEAHLGAGQPRQAIDVLRDMPTPRADVDDADTRSLRLLSARARGSAMLGEPQAVAADLLPRAAKSKAVRLGIVLPVAAQLIRDLPTARRWLEAASAAAPPDDHAEAVTLADAWSRLASRFESSRAELLARAADACRAHANADPRAAVAFAQVQLAAGQSGPAIDSALAALQKWPSDIDLLLWLADALTSAGRPAEAIEHAAAAARVAADSLPAWLALSRAQADAADRQSEKSAADRLRESAVASFQRALGLADASPGHAALIAAAADRLGLHEPAIAAYRRIIQKFTPALGLNLDIVRNNLAYAILQRGGSPADLKEARELARQATASTPLSPIFDTLGAIETALGDRPAAIAAFRRAVQLDPSAIEPAIGLADLLASGSPEERDEAKRLVESARAALASRREPLSPTRAAAFERLRAQFGQ